ncbi:hypothetical protein VTN00DRAFT_5702 [Thermoascus crustaceus]|uniref:uncharacterized protein n=1 Tax=Thermoascus crustaceus TaxID=5088 RepID=UPI0037434BED
MDFLLTTRSGGSHGHLQYQSALFNSQRIKHNNGVFSRNSAALLLDPYIRTHPPTELPERALVHSQPFLDRSLFTFCDPRYSQIQKLKNKAFNFWSSP